METIIVTGVTGQVGYYVAKQALETGMKVIGVVRYSTNFDEKFDDRKDLIEHDNFVIATGDLTDRASMEHIVNNCGPEYFVNCAAMSHVGESWKIPHTTAEITGLGVINCLESIKGTDCRFVQCSTSEMFGKTFSGQISETTKLKAMSPYGAAKIFAHEMVRVYRESYNKPYACIIMFNNTSPKRDKNFFVRKITSQMGEIYRGERKCIQLGNLEFSRDWGFSGDYARAIHMMLQSDNREEFIVSTGINTTGKKLIQMAFDYANSECEYNFNFEEHVKHDGQYDRPNDLTYLLGDNSKIKEHLGWMPTHMLEDIVEMMIDVDVFGGKI